jgi:hypothetical protein
MGQSLPISADTSRNSVAASGYANQPTVIASATSGGWSSKLAKFVFPGKPVQALVCYTHAPERTVCRWVHGDVDMPLRAFIALLHSKHGPRVLEYTMRGCKWWHDRDNEQLELPL